MGLGMFSNMKLPSQAQQDSKLAPPPPSSVTSNTTVRDGVQKQQVRLGKAAPKMVINQPEKSPGDAKSLLGG